MYTTSRTHTQYWKIMLVCCAFLCALSFSNTTHAQTKEEIEQKISEQSKEISRVEAEIAAYEKSLQKVTSEKQSLTNTLKELDLNQKKLGAQLRVTEDKITQTNLTIKKLALEIGKKQSAITQNQEGLAESIRAINMEDSQGGFLAVIVAGKSVSSLTNAFIQAENFYKSVTSKTTDIKTDKSVLESNKTSTEEAVNKLTALKSELRDKKIILDQSVTQKNKLLSQTKNQESSYKKLLDEKKKLRDSFADEMRAYESKLKYILDPNSLPASGTRPLNWPLGNVYITQLFGKTASSKRLYASGTHNGVDFRASVGTPVLAMATGTVAGTGNTDETCAGASFGGWVLIKYDNGLASTYGHLSLIKAFSGQKVRTGDIVGYSGNTGYSTGPHVHLSLYPSNAVDVQTRASKTCAGKTLTMPIAPINAYLDPMEYLPPAPKK